MEQVGLAGREGTINVDYQVSGPSNGGLCSHLLALFLFCSSMSGRVRSLAWALSGLAYVLDIQVQALQ
jgi:hypothetical protein